MQEHDAIERLGRWIAGLADGEVRLITSGAEITLSVVAGKVVSVRGLDSSEVARSLEVEPTGQRDLLAEAVSLAGRNDISQGQAVAAAKEVLQEAIASWLADDGRQVEFIRSDPAAGDGPTISLSHVIVEVVLSDQSGSLSRAILPDVDVLLRRADRFLQLYSPLRLSEEADLIVAKVTGQRTVREISGRSPHGVEEVHNLLAGLVAAGILETAPLAEVELEALPTPARISHPATNRRLIPVWILLAALAALLLAIIIIATIWKRPGDAAGIPSSGASQWAIVIDMGCEPQDFQRVLKKANDHPKTLKAVAADAGDGGPCWRLVWGDFASGEAANRALPDVPDGLLADGFAPHAIELPVDPAGDTPVGEGG